MPVAESQESTKAFSNLRRSASLDLMAKSFMRLEVKVYPRHSQSGSRYMFTTFDEIFLDLKMDFLFDLVQRVRQAS
jgi:hypothetical protein